MLAELPLFFALAGVAAYAVLGGADYGAGLWQLVDARAGGRERRELAHRSMSAVWEANHVWLIFVLVIVWTAYPVAFASIASTLAVPLFIAAVGIILRGTAYALRAGAGSEREASRIDLAFAGSSILTPFALGTIVGAIASGRVPVGNAAGDLWSSWTQPMPLFMGVLAVAAGGYMAAVFLTADAARVGREDLAAVFRRRALISGLVTGALAVAGLVVARADAERIYDGLTSGLGLVALIGSALAGLVTLVLLSQSRFELARYSAATAVGAIVAGWAFAQNPLLLPDLTVEEAAAGRATLVATVVAVVGGSIILFPSLTLLFRMVLHGSFDPMAATGFAPSEDRAALRSPGQLWGRAALAAAAAGAALTVVGGAAAELVGVVLLLIAIPAGAAWLLLAMVAPEEGG